MDLTGVAAVIAAVSSSLLGFWAAWAGRRRERRNQAAEHEVPPEIDAGMRAVRTYHSLVGDLESDRARLRHELDLSTKANDQLTADLEEEKDGRYAAERCARELRRRLAAYESVEDDEHERNRHKRQTRRDGQ